MNTNKHLILTCLALTGWLLAPGIANAGCTLSNVQLTSMEESPLDGSGVVFMAPPPINSTDCLGPISGNDSGTLKPSQNIGVAGDGLLNGEGGLVSPTAFTTSLQDIDGDGLVNDPGWIMLGEVQSDGATSYESFYTFNIGDLLQISLQCTGSGSDSCKTGTWQLETYPEIVDVVSQVTRSTFDHLAIVLKAGTQFAIYDFDFNEILTSLESAGASFEFNQAYSFTGTWSTADLINAGGNIANLSHASIWARDPIADNTVPEPGTLLLAAMGLLAAGAMRRRKH